MAPADLNALADDLEQLGYGATAVGVRKGTISAERALSQIRLRRDKSLSTEPRRRYQEILDKYEGAR